MNPHRKCKHPYLPLELAALLGASRIGGPMISIPGAECLHPTTQAFIAALEASPETGFREVQGPRTPCHLAYLNTGAQAVPLAALPPRYTAWGIFDNLQGGKMLWWVPCAD